MISLKRQFPWVFLAAAKPEAPPRGQNEPLREFVYLDEVSLASLLASQTGELTENITSQHGGEIVGEVGGKVSGGVPLFQSGEINSRFQTTNSTSLQTVRKANAQSLFRELHKLDYLRKIKPVVVAQAATSIDDLKSGKFDAAIHRETDLIRGDLVEFKVKLSASWIFKISAMVAEFSEMFDESPTLFMSQVKISDLYQAKNANKVISKLLAGLIPIEGVVSNYVVVNDGMDKLIVHRDAITDINAPSHPLRIVGVTEHLAYWKDIRRILFADNEFIMLCRISRSGIQADWNPIKVADIFSQFAPDLAKDIEVTSKAAMAQSAADEQDETIEPSAAQLALALARYKDCLLVEMGGEVLNEKRVELDRSISTLALDDASAEGQRAAFASVKKLIEESLQQQIDPAVDFNVRDTVRKNLDLPLFPRTRTPNGQTPPTEIAVVGEHEPNLLDVEVVAIYW